MKGKKVLTPEDVPANVLNRPRKRNKFLILTISVMLVVAFGPATYFYIKYNNLKKDPNIENKEDTARLVKEVGRIMILPADETPTVATISDKEKLKDQSFFAKAENGDKLLAYGGKYMQAVLYRPSVHKIVNIAPILSNDQSGTDQRPASENHN